jgi:hypothetical protein
VVAAALLQQRAVARYLAHAVAAALQQQEALVLQLVHVAAVVAVVADECRSN